MTYKSFYTPKHMDEYTSWVYDYGVTVGMLGATFLAIMISLAFIVKW